MIDNAGVVFLIMGALGVVGFIALWIFDRDPTPHKDRNPTTHKHHHKSDIA